MDLMRIVVLVVVGLIILIALAGEFRPRATRPDRRTALVPVRTDPGAEPVGAGSPR